MTRIIATFTFTVALALTAAAADLIIDDFTYASDAEAQAAWTPSSINPPVAMAEGAPWGERVMLLPCLFSGDEPRAYWDRNVAVDLSGHQAIALEIYAPHPEAINFFTLYLGVSDGWYFNHFSLKSAGWNSIRLDLGDFTTSSASVSLQEVERIRFSPWKGASIDTSLAVSEIRTFTPGILLTEGVYGDHVAEILDELGLEHGTITQAAILSGELTEAEILFVGNSANLSDDAMDMVDTWVGSGGRVIAFHSLPSRLASLLGLQRLGARSQDMRAMHFSAPDIDGLPAVVEQATWNIIEAAPNRPDARVIATWEADDGTMLTDSAWLLSDTGAWMSHVLLNDGGVAKRQMLLALIGHFLPEVWPSSSQRAIDLMGHVGPHTEFTTAVASIEADAQRTVRLSSTQAWLTSAESHRQSALASQASAEHPAAIVTAGLAREALRHSFYLSQQPRSPEMRVCWESQGTGPYPGDWLRTADVLADNGFTAVAPIMATAGMAHYPSALLPHSNTYDTWGDQIAQCVAGCHARGIEVHARILTWNTLWSPQSFVDSMRAQGRLQVDITGADVDWLCPSDPLNRAHQLNVILEVVQSYDVDGINLDYIRYPSSGACYCDPCRTRFETQTGLSVVNWPTDCHGSGPMADSYRTWRVEQITSFMREIQTAFDSGGHDVELSADVFHAYPACRDSVGQDWVAWVDEGLLDFVCPMSYSDSPTAFAAMVQSHVGHIAGRIPVVSGIGVTSTGNNLSPDEAIWQARLTRDHGANGFILFSLYPQLTEETIPPFGLGFTAPVHQAIILH